MTYVLGSNILPLLLICSFFLFVLLPVIWFLWWCTLPTTFPSDSCSKYWYTAMLGSVNLANQQLAWGDMETFDWDRKCFLWLVCVVVLSVSLVVLKRCFWLHHSNSATSKVRIQFGASYLENYLPLRINELNWLRIVYALSLGALIFRYGSQKFYGGGLTQPLKRYRVKQIANIAGIPLNITSLVVESDS